MHFKRILHDFLQNFVEIFFKCSSLVLCTFNPITKPIISDGLKSFGIQINGNNCWDIKVNNDLFYGIILSKGVTGLVESYIEGYIDCERLDLMFMKFMDAPKISFVFERYHPYRLLKYFIHTYIDVLTPEMMRNLTNEHYEESANFIKNLFDSTAHYSAMLLYDLKEVEEANLERINELMEEATLRTRENIARKLKLEPGMKVLDIGCGFGGLAKHLADKYKVSVTGVTICKAMEDHARKVCKGLDVDIILDDYRNLTGKFDRIVSIEMFENVGENHHREYFEKVNTLLKDDGIFVFQTHSIDHENLPSYSPMPEMCLQTYCYFPRFEEIARQTKGLLIIEHVENFGFCTGVLCKAVIKKLLLKKEDIISTSSEKEFRRWYFYACSGLAVGLSGKDRIYQIVFSKDGLKYAYRY